MMWLDELEPAAPDLVGAFRNLVAGRFIALRREIRGRMTIGAAPGVVPQLGAVADALIAMVDRLPDAALSAPGGEGDWNVAEAIGHTAHARGGLSTAGALAATDRWPTTAPKVIPGVPGSAIATRDDLRRRIALSQKVIERAARAIDGHETDPCPLDHPLVGRLRCGEWLLFSGVHDLMHLEQLHEIEDRFR